MSSRLACSTSVIDPGGVMGGRAAAFPCGQPTRPVFQRGPRMDLILAANLCKGFPGGPGLEDKGVMESS